MGWRGFECKLGVREGEVYEGGIEKLWRRIEKKGFLGRMQRNAQDIASC
jgi:hypothetical protein